MGKDDPQEPRLDDLLVSASYDGYFMGKRVRIINAPPEIALPALKRAANTYGSALAWMRFDDAYTYLLYSTTVDAGQIARRFQSGQGTKEVGTWTASKLLVTL